MRVVVMAKLSGVALTALALVGTAACSAEKTGNAVPGATGTATSSSAASSTSTAQSGGALASVQPCNLLSSETLAKYKVQGQGRTDSLPAGVSAWCRWIGRASDGASIGLGVLVRPEQGIAELKVVKGQLSDGTVNGRPARRLSGETGGSCTIALAVTASSRVDVSVVGASQPAEACQDASDIANTVEPQLPKYNG
jgi:Protein of unknown function (DUF3558)